MPNRKRTKKGLPHPIRFDGEEKKLISELQKATDPAMTVNDVIRRAIRFYVPKALAGEAKLYELKPVGNGMPQAVGAGGR